MKKKIIISILLPIMLVLALIADSHPADDIDSEGRKLSYLTPYDYKGKPTDLETDDVITTEMLKTINDALPENSRVPDRSPSILENTALTEIAVTNGSADIYMTFVHEGAGYKNVLGIYTYETSNPPQTKDDVKNYTIVFPNVSFRENGRLESGNKIHLGNYDAGTSIGFFLIANGWGQSSVVEDPRTYDLVWFSNPDFNTTADNKKQIVLLYDDTNDIAYLGFEDVSRTDTSSDEDFNDAIFYITATPPENIDRSDMTPIHDVVTDADNDGVSDSSDDFPNDPALAYIIERDTKITSFEDFWPSKGDYDFNDVVIESQIIYHKSPNNEYVYGFVDMTIRGIGARYSNDIAIQFLNKTESGYELIEDSFLESVSGHDAQMEATIDNSAILIDDIFSSTSVYYKNNGEGPSSEPETFTFTFDFDINEQPSSTLVADIYILIDGSRGRELHLPNSIPTEKVYTDLFQTEDDATDPNNNFYYKTIDNLPWAIEIVLGDGETYYHPKEKIDIINAYPYFDDWIESDGTTHTDWYKTYNSGSVFSDY